MVVLIGMVFKWLLYGLKMVLKWFFILLIDVGFVKGNWNKGYCRYWF